MKSGKLPSMSVKNGLQLRVVDESLTELENNLIALNINFQYIFLMQKSRWAATKKQMISVPVEPETVKNTLLQLPRPPKDAGLIEVGLKRKQEYDRCHRKEYIDPEKIYRALQNLKKCGHPYYQFYDDLEKYEKKNAKNKMTMATECYLEKTLKSAAMKKSITMKKMKMNMLMMTHIWLI